jgi:hypothetical protein
MSFVGHAARCLDGDMDLAGLASARLEKPGDHVAEASAAMGEFALPDFLPLAIAERHDMLLRAQYTDEPIFVVRASCTPL